MKTCQHKPSLLKHWQRDNENILGEKYLRLEFLNIGKEEATEILEFENLRVTEGQVFKYAAAWCLKNNHSEAQAEIVFINEFQDILDYDSLTSEDFVENLLPHSDIMDRECLRKLTASCFQAKTSGLLTRYTRKPYTFVQTVFSEMDQESNKSALL